MVRRVAVLGNGPSLRARKLGAQIDACDVVVRINRFDTTERWQASVGTRTDVYVTYSRPWPLVLARLGGVRELWWCMIGNVAPVLAPRREEWAAWCAKRGVPLTTIPAATVERAYAEMGITRAERTQDKKPTSGIVALVYAMERYPDAELYAAGFDGYQDGERNYYWSDETVCEYETRKIALPKQRAWYARQVAEGRVREFLE